MTETREEAARRIVKEFAADMGNSRAEQLGMIQGTASPAPPREGLPGNSQAAVQWLLIARVGMGLVMLPEDQREATHLRGRVLDSCRTLAHFLFAIPGQDSPVRVPDAWSDHPMGRLWHAAMIWALGDKLITIAEAAEAAGISTQSVHGRIARGEMQAFINPDAPLRQGRRLVLRREASPRKPLNIIN